MKTNMRNRRGSALIVVIIAAILIGSIAGVYLETATSEYQNAVRSLMLQQSINVAESGAEEALYALNNSDFTGWDTLLTDVYYRALSKNGSNGEVQRIYVALDNRDSSHPIIFVEGMIDGKQFDISKQLHIEMAGSEGGFGNGLLAKERIQFGGNGITVDSYDGSAGPYDYSSNRGDKVGVATLSVQTNDINLQHGDIWGYVSTGGGNINVGKNGSIMGEDSPVLTEKPKIDWDRVARDFYAELPDVDVPSMSVSRINNGSINGGAVLGAAGTTSEYYYNDLNVGGGADILVYGDVILRVDSNLNMNGRIMVQPGSTLTMYIKTLSLGGGNGIFSEDDEPSDIRIYGTSNNAFNFNGGALTHAVLYAPNSQISLGGSGQFFGSIVGKQILINGTFDIHYDERLGNLGSNNGELQMDYWRELTESSEKLPLSSKTAMTTYFASN